MYLYLYNYLHTKKEVFYRIMPETSIIEGVLEKILYVNKIYKKDHEGQIKVKKN